jgi:hypothetical protein
MAAPAHAVTEEAKIALAWIPRDSLDLGKTMPGCYKW